MGFRFVKVQLDHGRMSKLACKVGHAAENLELSHVSLVPLFSRFTPVLSAVEGNDASHVHLPHRSLGLVLIKIEKQPRRENVIHTIITGRMRLNILVHITDFRLDLWTEAISDPNKAAVLIEPQVRLEPWPPVRIVQIHEHLIPHHEICPRKERDRPGEFQKLTETRAHITTVGLPALFKPWSEGKAPRGVFPDHIYCSHILSSAISPPCPSK